MRRLLSLHTILTKRKLQLEEELALAFPSWEKSLGFGKKDTKEIIRNGGVKANVPVRLFKTEIFNPNSRDHIADRLINVLGWKTKIIYAYWAT